MTERDDRRLQAFFRDLHEEIDPPVPPYGSVIRPGRSAPPARAGAALALALGLALVAGVLLLVMRGRPTRAPGGDEAMRLASELSRWQAPTDFLLETPGIEFLQSPPRFGAGKEELPGDPKDLLQKEVRQ